MLNHDRVRNCSGFSNKKDKHECNRDRDDSNSSQSDGSGSTEKLDSICTKHNKINHCVNTYLSPKKATYNWDSNSLLNENTQVLWSNKDLNNCYYNDTLQQLDGNCKNTQSELTAKMLDPKYLVLISIMWAPPSVMNKNEESLLY